MKPKNKRAYVFVSMHPKLLAALQEYADTYTEGKLPEAMRKIARERVLERNRGEKPNSES